MPRGFMEPIGCSDCGDCVPIEEAHSRIADLEAKLAKREAQLEWCVRSMVWIDRRNEPNVILIGTRACSDPNCKVAFDGTPAGLLAAIDAATEGV